jgi:hypothetical protein
MSITGCNNSFNPAVRVPEQLTFDSGIFTVNKLGGFSEFAMLELIDIPDTIIEILSRAFYNCINLFEIDLPDNLQSIGKSAFQGCTKLTEVYIPASVKSISEAVFADCRNLTSIKVDPANSRYSVVQDCLIDNSTGLLIQGLSTGVIPQDGSIRKLGQHCFSSTDISSVEVPNGITVIPSNAFSRCGDLISIVLPDTLITLDATCFAWCSKLNNVILPNNLVNIKTYAFNSCALEDVVIPASVDNVLERSFGDMPSLKAVTFEKSIDENNEIKVPYIHSNAFVNSGSVDAPVVFKLPWSADKTPNAPWGAKYYELIFDYEEDENV